MGPRAFAHGDPGSRVYFLINEEGFNGAAGFRPRRHPMEYSLISQMSYASMGPRAFAHGDFPVGWGERYEDPGFNGAAGFRPRRQGSGEAAHECIVKLQWGRGLSPTETDDARACARSGRRLQWGRGLSPTETGPASDSSSRPVWASMGPRAFAHGDLHHGHQSGLIATVLQWGRGLSPTETDRHLPRVEELERCFNGAAGFRPRRLVGGGAGPGEGVGASMGPRAFAHGDAES